MATPVNRVVQSRLTEPSEAPPVLKNELIVEAMHSTPHCSDRPIRGDERTVPTDPVLKSRINVA